MQICFPKTNNIETILMELYHESSVIIIDASSYEITAMNPINLSGIEYVECTVEAIET